MSEPKLRVGIAGLGLILPHFRHYEAAAEALNAGKHLLLAKSAAPSYAGDVATYQLAGVPRPPRLRRPGRRGPGRRGRPVRPGRVAPGRLAFESVRTEVKDYVTSVVEGRSPLIDSRDTVYAMRIVEAAYVEAAYEAIRSDEKVISLAEVERAQIDGVTVG